MNKNKYSSLFAQSRMR